MIDKRGGEAPAGEGGGHHLARGPLHHPAQLERRGLDRGQDYTTPACDLDVMDRVGGGDGFASGLIYGLLTGETPEEAVKLGWAHGALLTTFPGDTSMATLDQVRALANGGSARIQR